MSIDFDPRTTAIDDITGDYAIDASHSRLGFTARHAMVTKVRGQFGEFEGTAHVDTADPAASSIALAITPASISTGSPDRDGHLRSADFFDVETYPDLDLPLHRGRPRRRDLDGDRRPDHQGRHQAGHHRLRGDRLGRRPVRQHPGGFEGDITVNRKDWGLTWNAALETGGVLVSEKVKLEFDVSAIKSA